MSAITVRAPAAMSSGPIRPPAWADEADRRHACGLGRGNSGNRILDHDAVGGSDLELNGCGQKQVGGRLAVGDVGCREQPRFEETHEASDFEAGADAVRGRGGGDGLRPPDPGQRMGGVGNWLQLVAETPQCLRRNRGCEVGRQASLRCLLYGDKNVSRPPSVKFTGHRFRRQRHADPAESRGEHHAGNRLTID